MKRIEATSLSWLPLALLLAGCGMRSAAAVDPVRFVDPFIGTSGHGHVYPGATVPFGMVQLSPDHGVQGWDWTAGYHRPDSILVGFSHTHLSGTGIGDLADILFLPLAGAADPARQRAARDSGLHARYRQENEQAEAGYYAVELHEPAVKAELTASTRVGWHRYTWPAAAAPALLLDLGFALNWDRPLTSGLEVHGDSLVTGWRHSTGWAKDQQLWFAAKFSRPITGHSEARDSARTRAVLRFAPGGEPLVVKVALSYVDAEGALRNLAAEGGAGFDFDGARAEARRAWAAELGRVQVASADTAVLRTFYTALYRTKLAPVRFDDADGRYRGGDGRAHAGAGFEHYSIFSLWDTFRAAHPLFTILDPERVPHMVNSMLAFERESGLLPVWSLVGNETNTMTGYHAIPVIADAYLKGIGGFDAEAAFAAMKQTATRDWRGVGAYLEHGYVPSELEVESVTKTLEYAYDDAAIARMAARLGRSEDAREFERRAGSWRNVFDPETRFMRGRRADGTWVTPFDPLHSDHFHSDYTEGNAWQHTWFVPHDVAGLIASMGGDAAFVAKLDSLFAADTVVAGANRSPDISGLIGQYAHGNEPSHHIAYLYSFAGAPHKTADRVREILGTLYRDTPEGLAGNEDCGQLSAWYVFSALGFYPVDPAGGVYVLGSPLFAEATIDVGGGRTFRVVARGGSDQARYIQGAQLNGRPLRGAWITHEEIMQGGQLELLM